MARLPGRPSRSGPVPAAASRGSTRAEAAVCRERPIRAAPALVSRRRRTGSPRWACPSLAVLVLLVDLVDLFGRDLERLFWLLIVAHDRLEHARDHEGCLDLGHGLVRDVRPVDRL